MLSVMERATLLIRGTVVEGDRYGRKLGFPTANLLPFLPVQRKHGIYAGIAVVDSRRCKAAIVIGPLLPSGEPKIEAYLLGFECDLYGKVITLELAQYIRPWKSFATEQALREQITKDIAEVETLVPDSAVSD